MNPLWSTHTIPPMRREALFGDRVVDTFADRAPHVAALLQRAMAAQAARVAVIDGDTRLTWAEVGDQVQHLAGGLLAQGVQPGERVVLWLSNRHEFVVWWLAVLWCGAVAVPVSIRETTEGMAYAANQCQAKAICSEADLWTRLPDAAQVPSVALRVCVDEGVAHGGLSAQALAQAEPMSQPQAVDQEDVATILYTSGTTGKPKGAMLTHVNIVHSCMHFAAVMGLNAEDRTLLAVPASHVTGLIANIATLVSVGGAIIIQREFKAAEKTLQNL